MNNIYSVELNKMFGFFRYSYELLGEPAGIFLLICTILFTGVAIFTWPKIHVKSFFVSFPILFLCITLFFYHTVKVPSTHLINYIEGVIRMIPFGVGYSVIYIIFYWISVGIIFLCSQQAELSTERKFVLCIINSIILWSFAKFWFSLATFITLFVDMLLP